MSCSLFKLKEKHDRKCESCEGSSATLYKLVIKDVVFKICPICKWNLKSDIDHLDLQDDCY